DTAEALGRDAGLGAKEIEPVGNRANRATAFARDLRNGQFFDAVKLEDGVERRRFPAGAVVQVLEREEGAAGEIFVGRIGRQRGDLGEKCVRRNGGSQFGVRLPVTVANGRRGLLSLTLSSRGGEGRAETRAVRVNGLLSR